MSAQFPSILSRIVWLHILALVGISIAILSAAYFLLNATANDFEERMLLDHAITVSRYLRSGKEHWSLQLPPDLRAIYSRGYGGYALAVVDDSGRTLFSSFPGGHPLSGISPQQSILSFFRQRHGRSIYYGMNFPVRVNGHFGWIQLAQDLENPDVIVDDVVALFLGRIAWIVIPIFGILLFIDILILRRALAPIIEASQMALAIGPSNPHIRLPTNNLPREVLPLARAVNEALARLESALRIQREFTADAAHELRTPLTVLRTHIDTMTDRNVAHALQADVDAMSRIVDQLLELAELESFSIPAGEKADLNAVCSDVVSMIAPIALADEKTVELSASPTQIFVSGSPEMLFRAIRNLVENAIRHTGIGTSVEVEISAPAIVRVKDRGPGIKPSERELIFHRFWRRDRADKEHSGIGLAIVAKTAQILGGSINVDNRPGGGAIFCISLPADGFDG